MRVVVVGPGAMGCLFAGLLSDVASAVSKKREHEVCLLDNDSARAEAIERDGMAWVIAPIMVGFVHSTGNTVGSPGHIRRNVVVQRLT